MLKEDLIEILFGLGATFLLGLLVKPLMGWATDADKPAPPKGMEQCLWNEIVGRGQGGKWLGFFERFSSFGVFWAEAYVVLAGWFAFKVAAKWETWKNIVQFPATLDSFEEVDYLRARANLGTWIFTKFTLGSLLNVSVGYIGFAIGRHSCEVWELIARGGAYPYVA